MTLKGQFKNKYNNIIFKSNFQSNFTKFTWAATTLKIRLFPVNNKGTSSKLKTGRTCN